MKTKAPDNWWDLVLARIPQWRTVLREPELSEALVGQDTDHSRPATQDDWRRIGVCTGWQIKALPLNTFAGFMAVFVVDEEADEHLAIYGSAILVIEKPA